MAQDSVREEITAEAAQNLQWQSCRSLWFCNWVLRHQGMFRKGSGAADWMLYCSDEGRDEVQEWSGYDKAPFWSEDD